MTIISCKSTCTGDQKVNNRQYTMRSNPFHFEIGIILSDGLHWVQLWSENVILHSLRLMMLFFCQNPNSSQSNKTKVGVDMKMSPPPQPPTVNSTLHISNIVTKFKIKPDTLISHLCPHFLLLCSLKCQNMTGPLQHRFKLVRYKLKPF